MNQIEEEEEENEDEDTFMGSLYFLHTRQHPSLLVTRRFCFIRAAAKSVGGPFRFQDRMYFKKPLGRCTRTIAAAAGKR
jgi:hypothetical protein